MKFFLILSLGLSLFLCQCRFRSAAPSLSSRRSEIWAGALAGLDSGLARLESLCGQADSHPPERLQEAFRQARLDYKRAEYLWEYGFPEAAAKLNGPAVDEVEMDCEHTVIPAEGFQVLEEMLFPEVVGEAREMAGRVSAMRRVVAAAAAQGPRDWSDSSLVDAAQLELARLAGLGLGGFDSPLALQSLPETRAALGGLQQALETLPSAGSDGRVFPELARERARLRAAREYLDGHRDFAAFDRAFFLTRFLSPSYGEWAAYRDASGTPLPNERRAFSPEAGSLFASSAWNSRFFAPPFAREHIGSQVDLGRRLFFDPVLSGGGMRSCASCHQPELGFGDGRAKSPTLDGKGLIGRNTPTLLFAAYQHGFFWDMRAESLEDQASMVIHNPREMGGSLDSAVHALQRDERYRREFLEAFASDTAAQDRDMPVTPMRVRRVLAAYIRSLSSFDSPWDRHMRGDSAALSAEARLGFAVFMGKGKCATCHFPPLFNGTPPPLFAQTDLEVLGVPAGPDLSRPVLDGDSGRMVQDHVPQSLGAFKTPTVRNVEFTGPYMHNGVFRTLEEVVEFYDRGGGAGLGLHVPNQTLPADSLKLDRNEKRALVIFLKALSDTSGMLKRPSHPNLLASRPDFEEPEAGGKRY